MIACFSPRMLAANIPARRLFHFQRSFAFFPSRIDGLSFFSMSLQGFPYPLSFLKTTPLFLLRSPPPRVTDFFREMWPRHGPATEDTLSDHVLLSFLSLPLFNVFLFFSPNGAYLLFRAATRSQDTSRFPLKKLPPLSLSSFSFLSERFRPPPFTDGPRASERNGRILRIKSGLFPQEGLALSSRSGSRVVRKKGRQILSKSSLGFVNEQSRFFLEFLSFLLFTASARAVDVFGKPLLS